MGVDCPLTLNRGGNMFIARWIVDVRFGQKTKFKEVIKKWYEDVGDQVGLSRDTLRVTTGSIGAKESRFEFDHTVESLEKLQKMWDDMAKLKAHEQLGQDMEPLIVSGSNRWEIFRVVDLQ